jgi:hypothetical protein
MPSSNGLGSHRVKATSKKKGQFCLHITKPRWTHHFLRSGKSPSRRGPKGYFKGSRKDYLESQLPEYAASKKGGRLHFWHGFYCGWWERFPWKLDDQEEPPQNNPEMMASLASVERGEDGRKKDIEK